MFDYTRAAGRKIKKDIDHIGLGLHISTQLLSIFYLCYLLFFGSGLLPVKITLLTLSVVYFLFFCIATAYSVKKELKRKIKLVFTWSRRIIKLINLGIIIYGFANAEHNSFSLILVAFAILSWGLDLVIGVLSFVLTSWLQLFFTGVETDMEEFKKSVTAPFTATGNFFKRMAGKEVVQEEKPTPTDNQKLLDDMVNEERKMRAAQKAETLRRQKEQRIERKQAAKQAKQAAKEEKKAAKQAAKQKKHAKKAKPSDELSDEAAITKE